jgi:hypothetical protein
MIEFSQGSKWSKVKYLDNSYIQPGLIVDFILLHFMDSLQDPSLLDSLSNAPNIDDDEALHKIPKHLYFLLLCIATELDCQYGM